MPLCEHEDYVEIDSNTQVKTRRYSKCGAMVVAAPDQEPGPLPDFLINEEPAQQG